MLNTYNHNLDEITTEEALRFLLDGNERFVNGVYKSRQLLDKVDATKAGQKPFAAILSCMDSRAPVELIFDQGIGDVFSIRIAGNIISENVLGSLEYAVGVTGSKIVVIMGHTSCGAVKGACDDVQLGNLTALLEKIKPSVDKEKTIENNRDGNNKEFVDKVATINVYHSINEILDRSSLIRHHFQEEKIKVVAAMYFVESGKVKMNEIKPDFLEKEAATFSFVD